MNYFSHALAHLDQPYFAAGTALPDWLSVVDRKVRLRPRLLEPHLSPETVPRSLLAAGALRHLADDDWFHRSRAFAEVTATLGLLFRERLRGTDGFRCGFLGHIVTEMLIDSVLIDRYPAELRRYYHVLEQVDPELIAESVAVFAGRPAERLAWFVQIFQRERILDDYSDVARLLRRLNQVLSRVKLTPLPGEAAEWLAEARMVVASRLGELLPPEHFSWPE